MWPSDLKSRGLEALACESHLGPLLLTWFNLIAAWISNHMSGKVGDVITVDIWEWI